MSLQIPGLFLQEIEGKGRGVFTSKTISEGDLIELCPVIILSSKDLKIIHETSLHDYYFLWGPEENRGAIALGLGSLYNHAENPNAYTVQDCDARQIKIIASRDISAFEEITISYHNGREDIELWFKTRVKKTD